MRKRSTQKVSLLANSIKTWPANFFLLPFFGKFYLCKRIFPGFCSMKCDMLKRKTKKWCWKLLKINKSFRWENKRKIRIYDLFDASFHSLKCELQFRRWTQAESSTLMMILRFTEEKSGNLKNNLIRPKTVLGKNRSMNGNHSMSVCLWHAIKFTLNAKLN